MRAVRTLFLSLLAISAVALTACAANTGAAASGGATTFSVPIEVENNLVGLGGASIYISSATGASRRLLGPVESGRKRTFQYDARPGNYLLTARQGLGQDSVKSEQFQLQPGMVIQWAIPQNRLLAGTRQ